MPAHWCNGLGTLLLNERARVRIWVEALFFFFFFSLKFSKFNSRGQRSLPVQEASQVGNLYRRSSNIVCVYSSKMTLQTWSVCSLGGKDPAGEKKKYDGATVTKI